MAHRIRWVLLLPATACVVGLIGIVGLLGDLPVPTAQGLRPVRPSTLILDRNGRLLYEVIQDQGKQTPLTYEEIPKTCWQATVAVEDSRYFQHPGFDPFAIARAGWQNLRHGTIVSGASTLTQQLARNTLMTVEERFEPTLRRKLREAWLAWRIEQRFSKEEILAYYHNQVYYGNFAHGLEAAAQSYYGKSARDLDLSECSLLAGILQNPAAYNPLENLAAARLRQSTVLRQMVQAGYIARDDAELALAESLHFAATPFPIEAPHFVSYVEGQLEQLLGTETVSQGGLRVYTSLDLDLQRQAEAIVVRRLQQLTEAGGLMGSKGCCGAISDQRRVENAAVVTLDPQDGAILVMVGSPDYFDATIDGAVNGATALRQPGSAIKPITYAAALDPQRMAADGKEPLTPATVVADVRTAFLTAEDEPYVPENYDRTWHGPVSVRTALASSYNTPAVKVLDRIGVDALIDQARRQGVTTFRPGQQYGLALTLGGGEVTLVQLTGAYAVFANGGFKVEPHAIQRVEDTQGNVLFQAPFGPGQADEKSLPAEVSSRQRARVLDERVAYLITDILSDNDARAPAFGRNSVLQLGRAAAVKTGTTTDWRDNWTVGYSPDLVTGVWVGNADNTPMVDVSGVAGAGPIWHDVMEMAHANMPVSNFRQPEGLVRSEICIDSGLLPTQWCTRRRTELFVAGTEPTEFDAIYRPMAMDACSGTPAGPRTASNCLEERIVRVYPPELQDWALAQGIAQPPITARSEVRAKAQEELAVESTSVPAMIITSPDPNSVFRFSASLPAELQQVRLSARPDGQSSGSPQLVTFTVNGEPVGQSTRPPYEAWWTLKPGAHTIRAVARDDTGQQLASEPIWIEVR